MPGRTGAIMKSSRLRDDSMIRRPALSDTRPPVILIALLLLGTVVMAQVPARDQPPAPRAGTGVIRGRVVRADTGEPLRRVQVRVDEWSTGDRGGPASTMTDAEGRYELTQLPAGRYQLKATRGGYVEVAYGQRRPFERGRPVELGEGAVLQNIDFALPPGAVVTGRVVDEIGEAVASVSVSLERRRYVDGARRLVGGERRFHGRPRGVQDLRRAARRLRDRRDVRRAGPGVERSRALRADLLPRDAGRERGATCHRRALDRRCPGSRSRSSARPPPLCGASFVPPARHRPADLHS